VKTGEEDEELIFKIRAKLFRWRNNEWKERGVGEIKLLRSNLCKKVRCVLRQDKTLKPVANFHISEDPLCILKEHQGSDKMFFFSAYDCSDETPIVEKFVFKFGNSENAEKFRKGFNDAKEFNKVAKAGEEPVYAPVINEKDEEEIKEKKSEEKKEEKTDAPPAEEQK